MYTMKESVAVAKEADAKKGVSPTRSDNSIHRVRNEPERQLGSLRDLIDNIRSDGGAPSVESIATELSSMHTAQRASVLLALQRTHGNRYVQRVVSGIQAKLRIGQPNDIYEQEADRIAEQVMRMPELGIQLQFPWPFARDPSCGDNDMEEEPIQPKPLAQRITPSVQRQPEEEEEKILQTKDAYSKTPETTLNLESSIQSLNGGGQPLFQSTRAFFEPRFGYDFSQVRVHTDATANRLNCALQARAVAIGNDIFFSRGAYESQSDQGEALLAHELVHVVQQGGVNQHLSSRKPSEKVLSSPMLPIRTRVGKWLARYTRDYACLHFAEFADQDYPRLHLRGLDETELEEPVALRLEEALEIHDSGFSDETHVNREDWRVVITEMQESSQEQTMRLVYEDDEGRFLQRAWRVGETAEEDFPTWLEERVDAFFDSNSNGGWHLSLPQSGIPEGRISFVRARHRGEQPRLGGRYPASPTLEPMADRDEALARLILIPTIRQRLSGVPIPTPGGSLGMRMNEQWGGYAYMAHNYAEGRLEHEVSRRYMDYLRAATLEGIGFDVNDARVSGLWAQFRDVMLHEGDPSAINAYDSEIVTLGAGFSGSTGDMGRILRLMPLAYRRELYLHGIHVNEDFSLTVLDLDRGVVEQRANALRILQVDPQRLGLLIHLAQSEDQLHHEGRTMSTRAWMLHAQFQRFIERNADVPLSVLRDWPAASRRFAFKLMHWAGSLSWHRMEEEAPNGEPNVLANYALRRIHQVTADRGGWWTIPNIQEKIRTIARLARIQTTIVFQALTED